MAFGFFDRIGFDGIGFDRLGVDRIGFDRIGADVGSGWSGRRGNTRNIESGEECKIFVCVHGRILRMVQVKRMWYVMRMSAEGSWL